MQLVTVYIPNSGKATSRAVFRIHFINFQDNKNRRLANGQSGVPPFGKRTAFRTRLVSVTHSEHGVLCTITDIMLSHYILLGCGCHPPSTIHSNHTQPTPWYFTSSSFRQQDHVPPFPSTAPFASTAFALLWFLRAWLIPRTLIHSLSV